MIDEFENWLGLGYGTLAEISNHLKKAKEKHPVFVTDETKWSEDDEMTDLQYCRIFQKEAAKGMHAKYILLAEVYEISEAWIIGDKAQAVDECYDAIAVLLRLAEMLKKQEAGK